MHTRTLFFAISFAATAVANAQGQWTQALQSSSPQLEGGTASRICPDNGIVSVGYYRNEAVFGGITLNGGFLDQKVGFVVKHNADGSVAWARAITNTDADRDVVVRGLAVDGQGNIVVGGTGIDTILVDGVFATENSDQEDLETLFIVKFSADGTVLWSVDSESTAAGSDLFALAVDPSDNIWFGGAISPGASKAFKIEGATGIEMVETGVIPGRVREIDTDAAGNVYLRGQSNAAFTLNGQSCPMNTVMGGTTTNWSCKLNSSAIVQWFHVPDQGHTGFSPWSHGNQTALADGRCYVEAFSDMRINGDTIAEGADQRGLYMLDASGAPLWWTRLNRTGILEIQDMTTDPAGNCWISAKASGVLDLLDTIVTHDGLIAFQVDDAGNVLQRVFGPMVEHAYSVDATNDQVVFGGEYLGGISFGTHALTTNQNGMFVARFDFSADVSVAEPLGSDAITAYPNPATDRVRLAGLEPGIYLVDVLTLQGQVLRSIVGFNPQLDEILLNELPSGALVLRVRTVDTVATARICRTY